MRVRMLVVLAALVVAGCDGGGSKPTTERTGGQEPSASGEATAEVIKKAGIGCDDFAVQERSQDEPAPPPRETGRCRVGGVMLKITSYGSPPEAQSVVVGRTSGCGFNRRPVLNERPLVVAGAQILELDDANAEVSNRIAQAVGGEVRTVFC